MSEKPSYYSILTSEVRYDKRLSDSEKLLYAEITSLTQKNGECWAGNKYFSDLYNVSERTITRRVKNLEEFGYLQVIYKYKKGTKFIESRVIKVTNFQYDKIDHQYDNSDSLQYDNLVLDQYDKFVGDNITSKSNITSINNKPYSPLEAFELFWNLYPKKNGKKPSSEKFLKLIEKSPELAEVIINDLTARKQTTNWTKNNGKYVPNATTYLNQERWKDELEHSQHSEVKLKHKQY